MSEFSKNVFDELELRSSPTGTRFTKDYNCSNCGHDFMDHFISDKLICIICSCKQFRHSTIIKRKSGQVLV